MSCGVATATIGATCSILLPTPNLGTGWVSLMTDLALGKRRPARLGCVRVCVALGSRRASC